MPRAAFQQSNIDAVALPMLPMILPRWLPEGRTEGEEYLALNPTRADRHLGSFKINLTTGAWADFAVGDRGYGATSLAAYIFGISRRNAANRLEKILGPSR
jgi:hypothetical protein